MKRTVGTLNYTTQETTVTIEFFSRRSIWQLVWGLLTLWGKSFLGEKATYLISTGLALLGRLVCLGIAFYQLSLYETDPSVPHFQSLVIWLFLLVWSWRNF